MYESGSLPILCSATARTDASALVMPMVLDSRVTLAVNSFESEMASCHRAPPPSAAVSVPSTPRKRSTTPAIALKPPVTLPLSSRNERDRFALFLTASSRTFLLFAPNDCSASWMPLSEDAICDAASLNDDVALPVSAPSRTLTPSEEEGVFATGSVLRAEAECGNALHKLSACTDQVGRRKTKPCGSICEKVAVWLICNNSADVDWGWPWQPPHRLVRVFGRLRDFVGPDRADVSQEIRISKFLEVAKCGALNTDRY